MLIESGLRRYSCSVGWATTRSRSPLETYGHVIDGDFGPALDLRKELRRAQP